MSVFGRPFVPKPYYLQYISGGPKVVRAGGHLQVIPLAVLLKNYQNSYLADLNGTRDTPLVPRGHGGGLTRTEFFKFWSTMIYD